MWPAALACRKAPAILLLFSVDCRFIMRTANIFEGRKRKRRYI